jgi:hypothetical protein
MILRKILRAVFGPQRRPGRPRPPKQPWPPTFFPPFEKGDDRGKLVFDPAARQYQNGFRRGDPPLEPAERQAWQGARRDVMHHLLELAANSPWSDHLVLRGSLALQATLGDRAREPGDIDWVVQPAEWILTDPSSRQMMSQIESLAKAHPEFGATRLHVDAIARTDIWTYERAPGHRLAFPWQMRSEESPPGVVQMDFVFEQKLRLPPIRREITIAGHPPVSLLVADEQEALAWKVLWLCSDMNPQGKDLYDAVLLAERTDLSAALLKEVLEEAKEWRGENTLKGFPFLDESNAVDWENFIQECPWVIGGCDDWTARLIYALEPTIEELRRLV